MGYVSGHVSIATVTIRSLARAEIRGSKWHDVNGDGVWQSGEPALQGWTIYLDLDQDGSLGAEEPSVVTDTDGTYAFTGLESGEYVVAEVQQLGWQQSSPQELVFSEAMEVSWMSRW